MHFEKYIGEGNRWIREYAEELGIPENPRKAWRVFRAMLHAVRDELEVDVAMHLCAQLPLLLKGVFVDEWDISRSPARSRTFVKFDRRVCEAHGRNALTDFPNVGEVRRAFCALINRLQRHVSSGEIDNVLNQLHSNILEEVYF